MNKKYQPAEFEKKWIEQWEKDGVYKTFRPMADKVYVLDMFPYPSAAGLHVGHPRGYTASDILARFYRMNGRAVLHPMGWDAFGLPAENAAIKAKKNPIDMVPDNIANFKRQMKMLGFSYDWDRELATTDPNYYKWTQWLFIQFFKMGILYKKNTPINFCPTCKTGLAEEEVLNDGTHERCGCKITKKNLPQWIFKITMYADKLLSDLYGLDWPKGILEMQKNWIGRSEGAEINFKIKESKSEIKVFTTRADTLYGVTAIVISPEHFIAQEAAKKSNEVADYIEKSNSKTNLQRTDLAKEKTGVFTGIFAIHPLTGEEIPVWVGDYILGEYGSGAVMFVPAHDERDFEFAKKYKLSIKTVIVQNKNSSSQVLDKAFVEYGYLVNSFQFDGLKSEEAMKKIANHLEKNNSGKKAVTYHLHDWIFSRQRYWGEPIPMIFCFNCAKNQSQKSKIKNQNLNSKVKSYYNEMPGWFPVPEKELPLKLPYLKSYEPTDTGESPLSEIKDWVNTTCPKCGGAARRETDTMPNWAGSCWYFIRFAQNQKSNIKNQNLKQEWLASRSLGEDWMPVDWYLGGAEHAVLHLLYARFWVKALYDLKLINFNEPFSRLRNVGMVLAEDGRKMSKSFGNVINPDDVVAEFGADSLRLYEMFMAPFSQEISWSTKTLQGVYRFLKRIWDIYHSQYQKLNIKNQNDKSKIKNNQLINKLNKTIVKVTSDIQNIKTNTAIAAMMEFLNIWEDSSTSARTSSTSEVKNASKSDLVLSPINAKRFLKLLAPFAPFITEEIWREVFGEKGSIHLSSWPKIESAIIDEEITIPVQVNGKLRSTLRVARLELSKDMIIQKALVDEKIKKYLSGQKYKTIYVKGKILNFVII